MPKVNVFEALESSLIKAIPEAIASLKIKKTICCLRIYYFDTHAPAAYFKLKTVTESFRKSILSEKADDAPFYLWSSTEEMGDGPSVDFGTPENDGDIGKLFAHLGTLLEKDEDKYMPRLRELLHRVSLKLNAKKWSKVCKVTEDFAVVPADGSQYFADDLEDIVNSIPEDRLHALRSAGLLGEGEQWDRRPGTTRPIDKSALKTQIEARAKAMSSDERIQYWVDQLDKMAAGADCDVGRLGYNAHYPLNLLEELGKQIVEPLLRLAVNWADKPEFTSDDEDAAEELPMQEVILLSLWKVKELKKADRSSEALLIEFLEKSCTANEGRSLWGVLPVHCAKCLHEHFKGYPKPEMEGSNALENRAEILAVARSRKKAIG